MRPGYFLWGQDILRYELTFLGVEQLLTLVHIGICTKLELTVSIKIYGGSRHDGVGVEGVGDAASD